MVNILDLIKWILLIIVLAIIGHRLKVIILYLATFLDIISDIGEESIDDEENNSTLLDEEDITNMIKEELNKDKKGD